MWNDKIGIWLYGLIWLCQDLMEINCILVGTRPKTNGKLNNLSQTGSRRTERNGKIISEQYEHDYIKGTGVKKKHSNSIDADSEEILFNNSFNEEDGDPYFINFGLDPFGSSLLWNGQERSPANFSQNGNYSSENSNKVPHRNKSEIREKRGITHLYNMIQCVTGCNPLSYKGYGCYCGFLGSGNAADPIDRCCMHHDLCYTNVRCPAFSVYVTPYLWRCWNGYPQCALDHVGFGGPSSCASQLCQCDKQLAMCLSNWPCPRRKALCRSSPLRLFQNLLLF